MMRTTRPLLLALLIASPAVFAADRLPLYPLGTCAVAEKSELGSMGDPVTKVVDGREYRLCCAKCDGRLAKQTDKIAESVDKRIIAQQKPTYPMDTCVVAGERLGEDAVDVVVKNTLVRLCCNNCARKVKANPAPFLKKLDIRITATQSKDYPLTTCVVSGEPLDEGDMAGKTFEVIVGNRLLKVCCKGCLRGLKKDPAAALEAVEAGWKARAETKEGKTPFQRALEEKQKAQEKENAQKKDSKD
jgi:hypothetical protein